MKALIVVEPNRLEIAEIPEPQIGPYQALVAIETCGICNSTDLKLIEGTMYWAPPFPFVLGHESVGKVVEIGAKVRKFKVGDRVTRPIYAAPDENLHAANGGFAQFGIVTDARAMADDGDPSLLDDYNAQRQIVVPAALGAREAALAISLSETASVVRSLGDVRGKNVVVSGTGVAGLSLVFWLQRAGARVLALGRRASGLEKARQLGAEETLSTHAPDFATQLQRAGQSLDGALEATGDAPLAAQILTVLDAGAFAIAYGVPPTGVCYPARWKSASVEEQECLAEVATLLLSGEISPEWFLSHQWRFDEVFGAFEAVKRGEVSKGVVWMV